MTEWEYCIINVESTSRSQDEQLLERKGKDGWEFCSNVSYGGEDHFIFKREIPPPTPTKRDVIPKETPKDPERFN